jgi:3-phenylpropionate/trans-cinnamate dioxygenase ferredoxin component
VNWVPVAPTSELAPGAYRVVDVDGTQVAVFNVGGEFYAVEDICSHDGATLTGLPLEGEEVVCPRHGARFNVKTGAVLCAPAYEPIASFPVQVVDGVVQVRDDRWD